MGTEKIKQRRPAPGERDLVNVIVAVLTRQPNLFNPGGAAGASPPATH